MLREETHASGVADAKVESHEEAAHEKRNWVRLTYDCNNKCIFCLDSDTHDGEYRDREEVKTQILDGRKKGAERLILSGGEPTIHPDYVSFVKLGRLAGYPWIQTVTNGRLFMYPEFLGRCLDAGLREITFSLHGPNAKIHDALVGVKGAFEEEIQGLKNALADGRPVVNVDIVINRGNVKQLGEMLRSFYALGVREFDLLQVVPFGRAFTEGRDTLFYDLDEAAPYLREALEFSARPDVHVWMNRFPPQHLEGFEHLIQDPYKLNDEVRGRKEEFTRLLDEGTQLDCREPKRCSYCYLQRLCDTLETVQETVREARFDVVRIDTGWEAKQPIPFGGDPASSRRANGKRGLPLLGGPVRRDLGAVIEAAGATQVHLVAPDVKTALAELARHPRLDRVSLELASYDGLAAALADRDSALGARTLVQVTAATPAQLESLRSDVSCELRVLLTKDTAAWLTAYCDDVLASRIVLTQPTYERVTEARAEDVDAKEFFAAFRKDVATEGIPACITGRAPRAASRTFDTVMATPDGQLEIFRYTKRYLVEHYRTKSRRCKGCAHDATCDGVHVNWVRAHGYAPLSPVPA